MSKGKWILAIVIIAILIVLGYTLRRTPAPGPEGGGATPAATGNVDDAAAAILEDTQGDEPGVGESDQTVVGGDAVIDGVGQSLEASQL